MSSGLADGCDTSLEGMYNADLYTILNNICLSGHMCSVNGLTISEYTWTKLSEEDQAIIMKAVEETTVQQREDNIVLEKDYQTKLEEAGINFTVFENPQEVNDAFMAYWTETAEAANAVDLLDKVIALG